MANTPTLWRLSGGSSSPLPTGVKVGETGSTGVGSTTSTETQSQSSMISKKNTPDFALSNMEDLINQLMDRPNLSDTEAAAKYPMPERVWLGSKAGWGWRLPNGSTISGPSSDADAKDWSARQLANREKAQRESGVSKGGTAAQKESEANRTSEIQRNRETQGKYSKEAAFADASALSAKFSRELLETVMPQISKAIESSGTSGGAVSGILAQDAAARVAEAQASLGLQTATQYGQISNQLAAILADLSKSADPTMQALLQTLGLAKGTIEEGVSSSSSTGTKTSTTTEAKSADSSEAQAGNSNLLQQLLSGLKVSSIPGAGVPQTQAPNVASGGGDNQLESLLKSLTSKQQGFGAGYTL